MTADQVADPQTGAPGLRVRLLDTEGAELLSELRTSGRLMYFGTPEVADTVTVEVTARLKAATGGTHRIGFAGSGPMLLEVDGTVVLDEDVALTTGDPVEAFLNPPQRWVEIELTAGQEVAYRLVHTRPEQARAMAEATGIHAVILSICAREPRFGAEEELAHAAELAASADAVVLVVGTDESVESEGFDRATLSLPAGQDELAETVLAANPATVVVVNSGGPVLTPWADRARALLLTWFPGQECGNALADVLLGLREPGGRLPTTWAAREQDVPVLDVTPVEGVLPYREGLHIGHRAWLRSGAAPAFWFGEGQGYTTWRYDSLSISAAPDGGARLDAELTNTGTRPGREVVQAYLSRAESAVERPVRWLAGFAAAEAEPGETVHVRVDLPARVFAHWSVDDLAWRVEPGRFTVHVGHSAANLPLTADLRQP